MRACGPRLLPTASWRGCTSAQAMRMMLLMRWLSSMRTTASSGPLAATAAEAPWARTAAALVHRRHHHQCQATACSIIITTMVAGVVGPTLAMTATARTHRLPPRPMAAPIIPLDRRTMACSCLWMACAGCHHHSQAHLAQRPHMAAALVQVAPPWAADMAATLAVPACHQQAWTTTRTKQ